MIHGSCMSSLQWTRNNHNHGEILANDLNKTLLYLNYNSGRHISTNGKNLNKLLKTLSKNWPVPIKEIAIIAHSMGGLVTRSTLHYAKKQNQNWAKSLKKVVFLGTPHHGSPIEKIGNYLDLVLATVPYAKPFAKLGKIRSAGVTDLRYGNIIDKDWKNKNRFELKIDERQTIQLPKEIEFYAIAGVLSNKLNNLLGDSLVDLKSALGKHKNPDKDLNFLKENTLILFENNHLDLLSNPQITDKLKVWLS
jgi:pimeloyl-ACP methyl ester carboxylesterase